MKISLNLVQKYLDFELPPTDELVKKIGAQLGAVEEVVDLGKKYQGITIVKVLESVKHPDADKLHVCKIDAGKGEPVQVVCGAPNVRAGLLAAWIAPGTTIPSTFRETEPFVVETRDIRGIKSNGMLASPKELALGDSHEGLLELDQGQPGDDFAKVFNLKNDIILDIENKMFTHRPDCFGFIGVARELAGILHKPFKSPDWYAVNPAFPKAEADELKVTVKNEVPKLAPRFTAVALRDVRVGPSPAWLQAELAKVGQKAINNVVDLTNYYMLLSGQPLHAYDYDKVKALSGGEATIVVRQANKGEKLKLLGGKEVQPTAETIVIATDKQAIGLGGVMGGAETEVDESTTNVILECANFDMYSVRRTAMALGLFTDAVTRFTKGQSPLQCAAVSAKTVEDIRKLAGGKVAGPLIDVDHSSKEIKPVKVSAGFINERLGLELPAAEMQKLLENVEFKVGLQGDELIVTAPFWRTDIEIPEDVVEEAGRLYGYDHLPLELPRRDLTPAPKDPLLELKSQVRARLAKAGANEVLTYSFVHGDLLNKTGQDSKQAYQIANALSPDLQYYRMSLMPSLLDKVHANVKAGHDEFALFEIGKVHGQDLPQSEDGLPGEYEFTGLVVAAADKLKKPGAAYYEAQKYLQELTGVPLEFRPVDEAAQKYAVTKPYDPKRSAMVSVKGGSYLGIIGEFRASVRQALKLPRYTAGLEIDTTQLQNVIGGTSYAPLPRFPKLTQDITLKVAADLPYQELTDFFQAELEKAKPKNSLLQLSPLGVFQPENARHKNVTYRLQIASYERTLTDAEVNKLLDAVAATVKNQHHAERV